MPRLTARDGEQDRRRLPAANQSGADHRSAQTAEDWVGPPREMKTHPLPNDTFGTRPTQEGAVGDIGDSAARPTTQPTEPPRSAASSNAGARPKRDRREGPLPLLPRPRVAIPGPVIVVDRRRVDAERGAPGSSGVSRRSRSR